MESKYCQLSSQKLHYLRFGKGKIVFILPSLLLTSRSYKELASLLSKQFDVIIPDLYKGKSEFKKSARTLLEYAKALDEFVEKLQIENYYLIGFSGSGFPATYYTEHFNHKPKKLLLFSTSYNQISMEPRTIFVIKGYIKLLFNNFLTKKGRKVNMLWIVDSLGYFKRHPSQFIKEAFIPLVGKYEKASVPTVLYVAQCDEFLPYREVLKVNTLVKNLKVELLQDYHAWFFIKQKLFVRKVNEFFTS